MLINILKKIYPIGALVAYKTLYGYKLGVVYGHCEDGYLQIQDYEFPEYCFSVPRRLLKLYGTAEACQKDQLNRIFLQRTNKSSVFFANSVDLLIGGEYYEKVCISNNWF